MTLNKHTYLSHNQCRWDPVQKTVKLAEAGHSLLERFGAVSDDEQKLRLLRDCPPPAMMEKFMSDLKNGDFR